MDKLMHSTTLTEFFEAHGFSVYPFEQDGKQCSEIEQWTEGGVDMTFVLIPFCKQSFIKIVEDFDVDSEIDTYRRDRTYRDVFTIKESLKDFTKFHKLLKTMAKKIEKLK